MFGFSEPSPKTWEIAEGCDAGVEQAVQQFRQAILARGRGIGSNIVKVDGFVNHRVDVALITALGCVFQRRFERDNPDLVLTVEAGGIAPAFAAAQALGVDLVFAKKLDAPTQTGDMAQTRAHSFTHGNDYIMRVDKRHVSKGSRVLIIDDFLADGQAARALIDLCEQCGAQVAGVGVLIEKGFQPGGQALRAQGIHVESLAVVQCVADGVITLRDDDR